MRYIVAVSVLSSVFIATAALSAATDVASPAATASLVRVCKNQRGVLDRRACARGEQEQNHRLMVAFLESAR